MRPISLAMVALADALNETAAKGPLVRQRAATALNNAETISEDEACVAACNALVELHARLAQVYEAAAVTLDGEGGVVELLCDVPLKSACIRIEARIAATMPYPWMIERAGLWREFADYAENSATATATEEAS